jgi:hypothetical protein
VDPILTPILSALSGLGPWGLVIGAALTIGVQWLRSRVSQPADPASPLLDALLALLKPEPKADPAPAPKPTLPIPDDRERLILNLLNAIRGKK